MCYFYKFNFYFILNSLFLYFLIKYYFFVVIKFIKNLLKNMVR